MTDGTDFCKTCFHEKSLHYQEPNEVPGHYTYPCSENEGGLCKCENYIHGETRVTSSTGAQKGTKEERFDLIPVPALTYLARLYGKGALKYADHNWRLGYDWSKSYSAAQRHMNSFWAGEDMDPETQIPHVINAAFHMFALATYLTEHPELDDRFETRESERPMAEVVGEAFDNMAKQLGVPVSRSNDTPFIQTVEPGEPLDQDMIYRQIERRLTSQKDAE